MDNPLLVCREQWAHNKVPPLKLGKPAALKDGKATTLNKLLLQLFTIHRALHGQVLSQPITSQQGRGQHDTTLLGCNTFYLETTDELLLRSISLLIRKMIYCFCLS